ncbi:MAG TPA: DUF4398 domain-containing protein [Steroidobacteraceae bacterium]|nr:DUF4398 domain-containing protein [Steroidobacteraceae bacterium]
MVLSSALASCAAGPPPSEELTRARALVDQADKGQAGRYAAADLQRAHDELSAADAANRNSQYDVARRNAEAAAVDADVATARASEAQALAALDEVRRSNEALRTATATSGAADDTVAPALQAYPAAPPPPPPRDRTPPPDADSPR